MVLCEGRQSIEDALSDIDYKFRIFIHSKEYGSNLYLQDFHEKHLWTIITRAWYVAEGSNGVESKKNLNISRGGWGRKSCGVASAFIRKEESCSH